MTKRGERLTLRELTLADVEALQVIYGDPATTRHLTYGPRTRAEVELAVGMAMTAATRWPRTEYLLGGVLPDRDEPVGVVRLALDLESGPDPLLICAEPLSARMGLAVDSGYWHRGYGSELALLALALGFDHLGLHRVWGLRSPESRAADRLMRRVGMVQERVIRDHLQVRGEWRDSIVHSILREEWEVSRVTSGAAARVMS